jgi:hypothetical protein
MSRLHGRLTAGAVKFANERGIFGDGGGLYHARNVLSTSAPTAITTKPSRSSCLLVEQNLCTRRTSSTCRPM